MRKRRGISPDDLERLRVAVRSRVGRSTLRAVAREVRMSPTGLRNFIDAGTAPYAPTIERLRIWYHQRTTPKEFGSTSLLQPFFASMPEGEHPSAVRELAHALVEIYERRNTSVPAWIRAAACRADSAA